MTRKDFIAKCTALGLGASLMPGFMVSCKKDDMLDMNFSGSVLIIGAGSAGLMAGYTLNRYGIDFKILEASAVFGGRVKMADSFTDFPIDVGAEWVHGRPTVFSELIDDGPVTGSIDLIPYRPGTVYTWNNGSLHQHNWVGSFYGDYKFKSSTWYQFLNNI
ncbi:MAG: NAD(P)-binding protein [Bacteroidetes bacterium]|nr:NAD(P)-binding protein [Bacteroidota bacterium]